MAETTPTDIPAPLLSLLSVLSASLHTLERTFHRLPGSPILVRYIKSSYQDDPWRSVLELFLVAFAVRTLLKGRTRGEGEGKNWVKLSEKVGDVVDQVRGLRLISRKSMSWWMTLPQLL